MKTAVLSVLILLQNPVPGTLKPSHPEQKQTRSTEQPAPNNQRGTQNSPVFVKIVPTPKTPDETAQESQDRTEKAANDGRLVLFTGLLALIGGLQLAVFGYQAYKLKQTVEAASGQSKDMKDAIAEAARSATAMEVVAQHLQVSSATAVESNRIFSERGEMQIRAYIGVDFQTAGVQDGQTKFGAVVRMTNFGPTPAHQVRFSAKAKILPQPLPENFDFGLEEIGPHFVVGPHQSRTITQFVDDMVPEADIDNIKFLRGKALYMWGTIEYDDAFSKHHSTDFSVMINWSGQNVFCTYLKHNKAT